jgi:hypothetical protein
MSYRPSLIATAPWLAAALLAVGCNGGGFTGISKSGGSSKSINAGGNDGDENCDPAADPDCESLVPGDADGDGVPDDNNNDGIPDIEQGGGDGTGSGTGTNTNPGDEPGIGGDDPGTNQLLEDGKANFLERDNAGKLVLQRLVNGAPDGTAITLDMADDDEKGEKALTKACFTFKKTCFQIKWVGKVEQMLGRDSCIEVDSQDENSLTINADGDGSASIGGCLSGGGDEKFTVSCPHGIEPQGCTG